MGLSLYSLPTTFRLQPYRLLDKADVEKRTASNRAFQIQSSVFLLQSVAGNDHSGAEQLEASFKLLHK